MKSLSVTIQMKVIVQHFPVALFTMLYKVDLTFESLKKFQGEIIQMKVIG